MKKGCINITNLFLQQHKQSNSKGEMIIVRKFAPALAGKNYNPSTMGASYSLNFKCVIHTDSAYVLNGATKWIAGWKARGWFTAQKEQVLNRDLWEKLAYLLDDMPGDECIQWKLLAGHVGIPGNERCDEIATSFADNKSIELFDGIRENYSIDLSKTTGDISLQKNKSENKKRSNAPAYSYVSMVDGEIKIHKTWAECEARVKGVKAAKFKKSFSKDDETKIIAEWKQLK